MEEGRKKSKGGEAKEKSLEVIKVRDYIDIATELTGLVRENYLMGFQFGLSLWEANLKVINKQIEQWMVVQESYAARIRELIGRLPNEAVTFWGGNPKLVNNYLEGILSLEKDYASVVMNTSDRFMKEALTIMKKGY